MPINASFLLRRLPRLTSEFTAMKPNRGPFTPGTSEVALQQALSEVAAVTPERLLGIGSVRPYVPHASHEMASDAEWNPQGYVPGFRKPSRGMLSVNPEPDALKNLIKALMLKEGPVGESWEAGGRVGANQVRDELVGQTPLLPDDEAIAAQVDDELLMEALLRALKDPRRPAPEPEARQGWLFGAEPRMAPNYQLRRPLENPF